MGLYDTLFGGRGDASARQLKRQEEREALERDLARQAAKGAKKAKYI